MIGSAVAAVLGGAHKVFLAIAPLLKAAAPWVLAGVVGALAYHIAPVYGARQQLANVTADLRKAEADRDLWAEHSAGWEQSFRISEANRTTENAQATAAATALASQCSTRVAEARASARVIERIVTKEPSYDANRCPVRERVDPGLLQDALGPRAATNR